MTNDLLSDPFAVPAEPTPEILKNGSYWLPPINDPTAKPRRLTRATTLVKTVSDMFLIDRYHQREVIIGLTKREDLYDRACGTDPDDKRALEALAVEAMEAAKAGRGYAGAEVGTAFHAGTERLDKGQPHGLRTKWDPKMKAYLAKMEQAGFTAINDYIERRVVVEKYAVAGTFDRILLHNGRYVIADLKSQKTFYTWWEIASQLAIYAHGDAMWNEEQRRWEPMPKVDQDVAKVFWMPIQHPGDDPDAVDIYDVDIAKGWRAVDMIDMVRKFRKQGETWGKLADLSTPKVEAVTRPLSDDERFAVRLDSAETQADLVKLLQEMTRHYGAAAVPAHLLKLGKDRYPSLPSK